MREVGVCSLLEDKVWCLCKWSIVFKVGVKKKSYFVCDV